MIARPYCKSDAYKYRHRLMPEPMMNRTLQLGEGKKLEAADRACCNADPIHLPRLSQL